MQPLVAIVLLWVTLRLPIHLAKVAMLGAAPLGGGIASRAVSYAAGSQLRDTLRGHLPGGAGSEMAQAGGQSGQAESRTATRLRQAATLAGATATGGSMAGAAASTCRRGRHRSGRSGRNDRGTGHRCGGRRWQRARVHAAADRASQRAGQPVAERAADPELRRPRAGLRERDVRGAVPRADQPRVAPSRPTAALESLPENTQRGVGQLVSEHGAGAREHLAYQALGEWSPEEREALRTSAAANPDVRAQAIDEVVGGEPSAGEASGVDTPAAAGPVGETPMNAEPRDVMRDSTQSPPSAASPTSSATKDGGAVGGSLASAGPDSPPPATRPPVREPRGPHPDQPFPNE